MLSLDSLLPKAGGSIFCLARMAMLRASEIHLGSSALVDCDPLDKETTIALREIIQGKMLLKTGAAKRDCLDNNEQKEEE